MWPFPSCLSTSTLLLYTLPTRYDAENRMTQAWSNSQWQSYTYDSSGQRVRRNAYGAETWQVYGVGAELIAEYAANASASSPQKEYGYRNGQLLITAAAPVANRTNVALAANGGTATASSYLGSPYNYYPSYVNDGARIAANGNAWLDGTIYNFPDWIEVDFNGSKTINEIDVVTQQDDYQNPVEPTLSMTFNNYGITAFDVQYWDGANWTTIPNGSVTGNNKVWRQFTFSAITTSKVRVVVNDGADHVFSRVVEVEAWGATSGSGATADIEWLVTDQLGTPRMIFDKTGSLAGMKRHDYLPFGEELYANVGIRSTTLGYTAAGNTPADKVRHKFTAQERDDETGLDYMHARYYANAQGRFTSADSILGSIANPQSLNRYAYVGNNPLNFSDPSGHSRLSAGSPIGHGQGGNMNEGSLVPQEVREGLVGL
jgi:RHS repeat-associated protein